ncbi:MAG TPA: PEGA domain-containing protein [Candidatus Moranbacteria bacterium]|nr:PEGA domain-containing protein [Candidatus Moranbacteria bacterium]
MDKTPLPKRIFFWTLVALFWLVSATIIGYAFGYRFSFDKGIFIYGGSITIKITPENANVYLNGVMASGSFSFINSSYHISGVKPGKYLLEVKADGYQSWSKNIVVHSGISTELWNIFLAENSYERENYNLTGVGKFFISTQKNLIAFSEQLENNFSVKVLDPETSEIQSVFSSNEYVFTDDEKENIEWSPQSHRLIIPAIREGEKNYFIVSLEKQETLELKNISQLESLSHVRWDPKNKDIIFCLSGSDLYRIDLNDIQNKKIIAKNIASYDLSQKGLFYFQLPEGIVYRTSLDAFESPLQITYSAPENMDDNSYQIIVYDEDRITFLNKSRDLYIYNKGKESTYFKKLAGGANGSQFSDDGKKLLYWTDNEISTYFVSAWEVQPTRVENENMSITRLSNPIKNVQWTRDYEHVLFINENKVKIIEIDNRDHRNMMDVLTLNNDKPLFIDNFRDGKLYFTDKNEQEQNNLYSIEFPKQNSLLQGFVPGNNNQTN